MSYVALYVVLVNHIRARAQFERLPSFTLATAILPCLYGVMQLLHLDWFGTLPEPSSRRLLSSLGNATFFGAYLVTLLPV